MSSGKRKIQPLITSVFKKRHLEDDKFVEDGDENTSGKKEHLESDISASSLKKLLKPYLRKRV